MKYPAVSLILFIALTASLAGAHPRSRIRTRAEAHLARGLRLMSCGQSHDARRELEQARRLGDAVVVEEATWALQDLGVDRRSIPIHVEDRVRAAGESPDASSGAAR